MKLLSIAKYVAMSSVLAATGCSANGILPDSRIADNTANVLQVSPASVTISDRHGDGVTTYYTARTAGRAFSCEIVGGALWSAGMVDPPTCRRL